MKHLISFLFIVPCLIFSADLYSQCDTDDYRGLRALYLSTNGPIGSPVTNGWDNAADWQAFDWSSPTTPPPGCDLCSLNGITCTSGRVTQIHLSNTMPEPPITDLSGSLPIEIGLLTELTNFNIGNSTQSINPWPKNNVSGAIPAEFEDCTQLLQIGMNGNDLSGTIPDEIYNLSNLTHLNLSANELTGGLSNLVSGLTKLISLSLGYNTTFGGGIPTTIDALTNLRVLNMENCGLNAGPIPNQLGSCDSLVQFIIRNNPDYSGEIPASMNSLPILEVFWGNNCDFNGNIPTFSDCPELRRIHLSQNDYPGKSLPTSWASLSNLTLIGAGSCGLTGVIPPTFGNLNNLEQFSIPNNNISGMLPTGFSMSSGMKIFNVENNPALTGNLHSGYDSWTQLTRFNANGCNFIGTVPSSYSNWTNCTYFEIGGNALSGDVPDIFGNMTNLFIVHLDSNNFIGSMPSSLASPDSLKHLFIQECGLTGCFADTLQYLCGTLETYNIDTGNDFDATWANFCMSGDGACPPQSANPVVCTFSNGLPVNMDVHGNACVHGMINVAEAVHITPLTTPPSDPEAGTLYFDANTAKLRVWDGGQWRDCW